MRTRATTAAAPDVPDLERVGHAALGEQHERDPAAVRAELGVVDAVAEAQRRAQGAAVGQRPEPDDPVDLGRDEQASVGAEART